MTKRFALTISRGTSAGSENLLVQVEHGGITGLGEMSPVSIGDGCEDSEGAEANILQWSEHLHETAPWEMQKVEAVLNEVGGCRSGRAALDMALYDWLGRRAGMPIYQMLGGDVSRIVPSSLTIGINPPDVARERVREIMARLQPKTLKIKLGSPAGLDADQAMFAAVREETPEGVALRVDANGGWTVEGSRFMITWLAQRGVEYVEQPLPKGQEEDLPAVHRGSPIPLFADESCRIAADVPKLAGKVDGINLKLMKAGGIREGLRVIHAARAHGLLIMMGCMSESSLAIAASVHLSPFADYLDLDSHLNLLPDPFTGLAWESGRVLPGTKPGLGVERTAIG